MIDFTKVVHHFARCHGVKISKEFLYTEIRSHPEYPSLLSITETLDLIGLKTEVRRIEKQDLYKVEMPFLAHMNDNNIVFVKRQVGRLVYEDFSGVIIIAIEVVKGIKEQEQLVKSEQVKRSINAVFASALVAIMSLIISVNLFLTVYFILGLLGLTVSLLILLKDLNVDSSIADKVCGTGKKKCDQLIKSASGKILGNIGFSDIGFVYFLSQTISYLIATSTGNTNIFSVGYLILSSLSLLFIAYSIIYQKFFARVWCNLCLLICAILLLQFVTISQVKEYIFKADILEISAFLLPVILVTLLWNNTKDILSKALQFYPYLLQLKRLRKNPDLFKLEMSKRKFVETQVEQLDFEYGNSSALVKIILTSDLFCKPCAESHQFVQELVNKYGNNVSIVERFKHIDHVKWYKKGLAIKMLYTLKEKYLQTGNGSMAEINQRVMNEWYKLQDLEAFKAKYQIDDIKEDYLKESVSHHTAWTNQAAITITPVVFVNGRKLPKYLPISDLRFLIPQLLDNEKYYSAISESNILLQQNG